MKIAIVDYGMGNIHSLKSAIKEIKPSIEIKLTNNWKELQSVNAILLPGVGNFGAASEKLKSLQLVEHLRDLVLYKKKPILGICLGMQLLFKSSEESPNSEGLGLIDGFVNKMKNKPYKIPHIGFNSIYFNETGDMLAKIQSYDFYFVHSFLVKDINTEKVIVSKCSYNEVFISTVEFGHIWGTQFHPEKSQNAGLRIISNFIEKYVY